MKDRRSDYDIMAELLTVAKQPIRKTHLTYRCNLNFNVVKKYLQTLLEFKLIEQRSPTYNTTDKGESWLERFCELRKEIDWEPTRAYWEGEM